MLQLNPVLSGHSKRRPELVFNIDFALCRSKVLQNALLVRSAIFLIFIKLTFFFKAFVLSIFEWSLKTGFTVCFHY